MGEALNHVLRDATLRGFMSLSHIRRLLDCMLRLHDFLIHADDLTSREASLEEYMLYISTKIIGFYFVSVFNVTAEERWSSEQRDVVVSVHLMPPLAAHVQQYAKQFGRSRFNRYTHRSALSPLVLQHFV